MINLPKFKKIILNKSIDDTFITIKNCMLIKEIIIPTSTNKKGDAAEYALEIIKNLSISSSSSSPKQHSAAKYALEIIKNLSISSSQETKPPTLKNRIKIYKIVNKKLVQIEHNECLKDDQKVLGGILTLNNYNIPRGELISRGHVIHISTVKDTQFNVELKLMKNNQDNINETKIMKNITEQILLKKRSKHFKLFYNSYKCDNTDVENPLISVSELAEGDLDKLLKSNEIFNNVDDAVKNLYNLLVQCIVSLGTFHNFGYKHNNALAANFFYQINNDYEEGYYKYKCDSYSDKTFYIKSCRYNIMLSDFGKSKKIINIPKYVVLYDIMSILNYFRFNILRIIQNGNYIDIEPYKEFNANVGIIYEYLHTINNKSTYNFTDLLEKLYTVVPDDILSQTIPKTSSKILNNQVFDMTIKDINPVT